MDSGCDYSGLAFGAKQGYTSFHSYLTAGAGCLCPFIYYDDES